MKVASWRRVLLWERGVLRRRGKPWCWNHLVSAPGTGPAPGRWDPGSSCITAGFILRGRRGRVCSAAMAEASTAAAPGAAHPRFAGPAPQEPPRVSPPLPASHSFCQAQSTAASCLISTQNPWPGPWPAAAPSAGSGSAGALRCAWMKFTPKNCCCSHKASWGCWAPLSRALLADLLRPPVPFTALTPFPTQPLSLEGERILRVGVTHAGGMLQLSHFQGEWVTLVEPHSKDLPLQDSILWFQLIRSWNHSHTSYFGEKFIFK